MFLWEDVDKSENYEQVTGREVEYQEKAHQLSINEGQNIIWGKIFEMFRLEISQVFVGFEADEHCGYKHQYQKYCRYHHIIS